MNDIIKLVMKKISENEDLKEQFKNNPPKSPEEFIELAKQVGVDLTVEAVQSACKELQDDELDKVSGGSCFTSVDSLASGLNNIACVVMIGSFYYIE